MTLSALLCTLWFLAPAAQAGTVSLKTDAPLTIERGGVTIARAKGAGELSLGEFPPGDTVLRITKDGMPPMDTTLTVLENRPVHLQFSGDTLRADTFTLTMSDAPLSILVFRPISAQHFSVIIDSQAPIDFKALYTIDGLKAGPHTVELRSGDRQTIWARGVLNLQAGTTAVVDVEEGRGLRVSGAQWTPTTAQRRVQP
jgi:hypothetical protein